MAALAVVVLAAVAAVLALHVELPVLPEVVCE
jgi:hypothetical protein